MGIAVAGVASGKLGEWGDSIGGSIGECGVGNYVIYEKSRPAVDQSSLIQRPVLVIYLPGFIRV
jgi:hypothetical protein